MAPNVNEIATPRGRPDQVARRESLQKADWNSSFPSSFDTYDDSAKFMQRCLLLSMSQLLYARGLLPATAFKKRNVTAIVRCQVPDQADPTGFRLLTKLKGAGEALHQGYLKEFIVVVGTNEADHDEALEVFIWAMHYNDEDKSGYAVLSNESGKALARMEYRGQEYVKDQTRFLLATIRKLCTEVLRPLPEKAFATFRITYTSKTPKGYQAPGFQRSPNLYDLHPGARSVSVGGIATGKHKFILAVDSVYVEDEVSAKATLNDSVTDRSTVSDASFQQNPFVDDPIEYSRVEPVELSPPVTNTQSKTRKTNSNESSIKSGPVKRALNSQEKVSPRDETKHHETTPPSKRMPSVIKKLRYNFSGKLDEKTPGSSPGKRL